MEDYKPSDALKKKREDLKNNPFLRDIRECYVNRESEYDNDAESRLEDIPETNA